MMKQLGIALIIFCIVPATFAAKKSKVVKFSDEELAAETVLPVFDRPTAVKKRNVTTKGRIELGGFLGATINDAFNSPINPGFSGTYHLSEIHAFQVMGSFFVNMDSQYVEGIKSAGQDMTKRPMPQYFVLGAYEFTPYYGKISLTKQGVTNLALYGTLGVGTISIENESNLAFSFGLGQKFYFGKDWGLKFDLRSLIFQGPDRAQKSVPPSAANPAVSEYPTASFFNLVFTVGVLYLL